ncbi:hypothetical protein D5086_023136 [Populus alba]|uniref:Uncharacterized protein n=1 Tax=Populus alba TaxID=43335 RepID=A0ACC4B9L5_POPAL
MAKNKKKIASISARGKRNQSLDLTDLVLALAAPAAFPASNGKNRLLKTLTGGSSRNKYLFQADDVLVEDGSEEEAFEEDEADNAEPEDDSGSGFFYSPTLNLTKGTTIASCEGARKTPDVAKSSGNPSATVAGTQAHQRHCKVLGHAIGVCSKATVESRTMGSHADMGSTKLGTASNGLVYAVDAGVEKNKGKDVAADHYCDPMQAEVDVMSADLETVRSNKSILCQTVSLSVGDRLQMLVWRVTKGTDVAAERKLDPMQTEVDVISREWETAQGKRKSPGSGDLNTQKSKDIARAPQGWKQRGQEGALDGVKIRSAHKVFIAGVSAGLSLYGNCIGASALFVSG